eukprot:149326-Prorocentrum_minimum.AAC.1
MLCGHVHGQQRQHVHQRLAAAGCLFCLDFSTTGGHGSCAAICCRPAESGVGPPRPPSPPQRRSSGPLRARLSGPNAPVGSGTDAHALPRPRRARMTENDQEYLSCQCPSAAAREPRLARGTRV